MNTSIKRLILGAFFALTTIPHATHAWEIRPMGAFKQIYAYTTELVNRVRNVSWHNTCVMPKDASRVLLNAADSKLPEAIKPSIRTTRFLSDKDYLSNATRIANSKNETFNKHFLYETLVGAIMRHDIHAVDVLTEYFLPASDQSDVIKVAIGVKDHAIAKLLIQKGADIDAKDSQGNSLLHYAVIFGSLDNVKLLVANGLLATEKNSHGQTPLDTARLLCVKTCPNNQYLKIQAFLKSVYAEQSAVLSGKESKKE